MKASLVAAIGNAPVGVEPPSERAPSGESSFAARYQAAVAEGPADVSAAPCSVRVESGDTLWALVRRQLESGGNRASDGDVLAGVRSVAARNRIDDPNVIVPGQTIDLAAVADVDPGGDSPRLPALDDVPGPAPESASAPVPETLDLGGLVAGGGDRVTSRFGLRRDPLCGERRFHSGIDIAAPQGAGVRAAAGGTVTFAGQQAGYGRTVVIDHGDGRSTVYAHLSAILVRPGDRVDASTEVARVGRTGRATGPHLHFELRQDGVAVDPALASLAIDDRA
ncbi:MAG: LysM peptidoglycan-binding domain-containing M23 family metallopeptidase [bacterium]